MVMVFLDFVLDFLPHITIIFIWNMFQNFLKNSFLSFFIFRTN